MTAISIKQLSKHFDQHHAVNNIDLEISSGSLFALLGPSGCGKTTLLRMIAGLEQQDDGQILFNEIDVSQQIAEQRNIGMVFQHYALFPHMNVQQNVAFGLRTRKLDAATIDKKVKETLALVGLSDKAHRPCPALSGGEQQRVALARAIVIEPSVLLFDEPLSNLDAQLRIETRHAIRQLVKQLGITSIFVTHDQEEALSIADDMAIMRDGVVLQQGSPEHCYKEPCNSFVGNFLGHANIFKLEQFSSLHNSSTEARFALIRPQHISIAADDQSFTSGVIKDIEFQGAQVRIYVEASGQVIDVLIDNEAPRPAIGETVHLHADAQHIRLLSA